MRGGGCWFTKLGLGGYPIFLITQASAMIQVNALGVEHRG